LSENHHGYLRLLVDSYYDVQSVRIETVNRIAAGGRRGVAEELVTRLMDWVNERMLVQEKELLTMVRRELRKDPLWVAWLTGVKGVGPCLAGGFISRINPADFETVSKVWRYCGMDVRDDGQAPRRTRGEKADWNPYLRTHCWKLGKSFVMVGAGYRDLYEQEKRRLQELHPAPIPYDPPRMKKHRDGEEPAQALLKFSPGHLDAMARRKVVKIFLSHYWQRGRELQGLPIRLPYCIEVLGHSTVVPVVEK